MHVLQTLGVYINHNKGGVKIGFPKRWGPPLVGTALIPLFVSTTPLFLDKTSLGYSEQVGVTHFRTRPFRML